MISRRILVYALVAVGTVMLLMPMPPARYRAAALLQIHEIPVSVSHLECWSEGWQEELAQCVGTAEVVDMPTLMAGWAFQAREYATGTVVPGCSDIPQRSVRANRCFRQDTPEAGHFSYVAFAFNDQTGDFYASMFRTGWDW